MIPQQNTSKNPGQELRDIVETHLHARGWDVVYHLQLEAVPTPNLIEAGINRESWRIAYQVDPQVEQKLEQLLSRERIPVTNPAKKLLCAGADHEEGHWSICPFDIDDAEEILHGIGTGLKKGGLKEEEIVQCTPEVANLFMDAIENTVQGLQERTGDEFSEGISLFYLNQVRMPHCSPGYTLFVDAQMKAYGKKAGERKSTDKRSLLKKIFGPKQEQRDFRTLAELHPAYKKVSKDGQRLLASLVPIVLAEKAYQRGLDTYDTKLVLEELQKRELWGQKAEQFAAVFAPYTKQLSQESNGDGQQGEASGQRKQQKKSQPEAGSGHAHKKHHGRCGFVRELLEDPETKKEILRRAIAKGRQAGPAGMPYVPKLESFEAIYDQAAEEIVLKYFKDDADSEKPVFDLFWMQNRPVEDDEALSGKKMHWAKTMFVSTPEGQKPWLYAREVPYQTEEELLPGRKGLEDMLFIVDVSGSMGWSGQPLDGSKYDLALRAIFGCIKSLEHLGRAAHARYGLILFSDTTEFSGWEEYYGLDQFKRLVFTGYQGGGTELQAAVVQEALRHNREQFLTILITDGEIYNQDAASTIQKIMAAGNDVVQFSIQGNTEFSETIKRHGASVISVDKPDDLAGLVIEKMKERYL